MKCARNAAAEMQETEGSKDSLLQRDLWITDAIHLTR